MLFVSCRIDLAGPTTHHTTSLLGTPCQNVRKFNVGCIEITAGVGHTGVGGEK